RKLTAAVLNRGDLIVNESTSPVGTTERASALLRKLRPEFTFPDTHPEQSDILIAYCPERILPGRTLRELTDNARVLGGLDRRSAGRARELYGSFLVGPMRLTTARVAELSKLVENAFRDVNVAFANELSLVRDTLGIDVWSVIKIANLQVAGADLFESLMAECAAHGLRPYLLGATPEVLASAKLKLAARYPNLVLAGSLTAISSPNRKGPSATSFAPAARIACSSLCQRRAKSVSWLATATVSACHSSWELAARSMSLPATSSARRRLCKASAWNGPTACCS